MRTENIDALKRQPSQDGRLAYRLKNANVYVSARGLHFTDYLDPLGELSPLVDASKLTDDESAYIETQLQANAGRFDQQVALVTRYLPACNARVLDIGCGGGLFLSLLRESGVEALGIELSDSRVQYARSKHGLDVHKHPIESAFWQRGFAGRFDAVTLWDVIEHVNYPFATLTSVVNVLKPGGLLFIDTPRRDSFYHRCGELTYRASGGRFPTFLNAMYSSHPFGHKQIFSTTEMRELCEAAALEVVELRTFAELSFPCDFYLKKLFASARVVKALLPAARAAVWMLRCRNKMMVVARKPSA
jgi:2-polyprenyl-6-hydroxyphenyl methylase/3-demethylubiquinone-9 3-methyltransferase